MKTANFKKVQAIAPAARSTANTTYNGNATIGSAVGIPIGDAARILLEIETGVLNASLTSVTYTVQVSSLATGIAAGTIKEVTGSSIVVVPADASKSILASIMTKNIVPLEADANKPLYVYIKRVQVGAFEANDSVSVMFTDHVTEPAVQTYAFDL
jgi:hypothetical protein